MCGLTAQDQNSRIQWHKQDATNERAQNQAHAPKRLSESQKGAMKRSPADNTQSNCVLRAPGISDVSPYQRMSATCPRYSDSSAARYRLSCRRTGATYQKPTAGYHAQSHWYGRYSNPFGECPNAAQRKDRAGMRIFPVSHLPAAGSTRKHLQSGYPHGEAYLSSSWRLLYPGRTADGKRNTMTVPLPYPPR